MIATLDLVLVAFCAIAALIGLYSGLGRVLKMLVKGLPGKIMAFFLTYGLFGVVSDMGFVQSLMKTFVEFLKEKNNSVLNILLLVRIDVIALAAALFLVIRILQKMLISVVAGIMEADNAVMKLINKTGGFLLALALAIMLVIIVFQIIAIANGGVNTPPELLKDTKIALEVYTRNPFNSIYESLRHSFDVFFK